jgi:hypothetical protein
MNDLIESLDNNLVFKLNGNFKEFGKLSNDLVEKHIYNLFDKHLILQHIGELNRLFSFPSINEDNNSEFVIKLAYIDEIYKLFFDYRIIHVVSNKIVNYLNEIKELNNDKLKQVYKDTVSCDIRSFYEENTQIKLSLLDIQRGCDKINVFIKEFVNLKYSRIEFYIKFQQNFILKQKLLNLLDRNPDFIKLVLDWHKHQNFFLINNLHFLINRSSVIFSQLSIEEKMKLFTDQDILKKYEYKNL